MTHDDGSPAVTELYYTENGCMVHLHSEPGEHVFHVHESESATVADLKAAMQHIPPGARRSGMAKAVFGSGTEHVFTISR